MERKFYRLIAPGSEWRLHREWFGRTALADLLGADFSLAESHKLYACRGHKEEYYGVLDGRFLGDRQFAEEVKSKAGEEARVRIKIKADALLEAVCKVLGMTRREVIGAGKDRQRVRARELVCHVGRSCTELSVKGLAEILGVDPTCVSRSVARMEVRLKTDKRLEETLERIESAIEH